MDISAKNINELRKKTGVGLMACKNALVEAQGSEEKAIALLKKKGMASAVKKADREANEGIVESYIHLGGKIGVLLELNCETDFVAKNAEFKSLAQDLAMHIAAMSPVYVSIEEIPVEILEKEKELARDSAEGKPASAIEKIVEGKIKKWCSEVCLMDQPFVKDQNSSVREFIAEKVLKTGENITVKRFSRYQVGC